VQIVHGGNPGPTLCLTAAVHGDELNGIEIVRQIMQHLDADELNGTVIGVPIVNLDGFRRASRYVSDRRDLNRHFPGSRSGSLASRIGYSFFHNVITHCQYLVDVHTGSFHRTNLPQLRAHLKIPAIVEFTKGFGGIVVVQEKGEFGTLRRAAQDRGIVAVTLETGGPLHLEKDAVDWGVKGIENLLHSLDMQTTLRLWTTPQPVYYKTKWVRAEQGGLLFSEVELNDVVKKGQLMGRVTDPITNTSSDIIAPGNGRIVGMAFDQVVSPGFAAYHMGIEAPAKELSNPLPAEQTTAPMMEDNDIPAGNSQEDNVPDEAVDTHDPLVD
jgi:predicted deacylase